MKIHLSDSILWENRQTLATEPGIYVISKAHNVIYIGKTWGGDGLRGRISDFHRSATTGHKGHAGGVTYFGKYGALDVGQMSLSVHIPTIIRRDPEVLYPYIHYAERLLIWEYVELNGKLPDCNSE